MTAQIGASHKMVMSQLTPTSKFYLQEIEFPLLFMYFILKYVEIQLNESVIFVILNKFMLNRQKNGSKTEKVTKSSA